MLKPINLTEADLFDAIHALKADPNLPALNTEVPNLYLGKARNGGVEGVDSILPTVPTLWSPYRGVVNFEYDRVDLQAAMDPDLIPYIEGLGHTNLHNILPYLNRALGTGFETKDFVNVNVEWLGTDEEVNIPVNAVATSRLYKNGFIVRYKRVRPFLDTAVNPTVLDALQYAHEEEVEPGLTFLEYATWGLDFTEYLSNLKIQFNEWYYLSTEFRAMMASIGFVDWPAVSSGFVEPPKLYSTNLVPEANQSFTHVYVQKVLGGGESPLNYTGTAYFHVNLS